MHTVDLSVRNRLLAALPPDESERLRAAGSYVSLEVGKILAPRGGF